MHKIKLIFLLVIVLLMGCGNTQETNQVDREERAEVIFNAIKNKDTETIKSYYSPYVQQKVNLDEELEKLVNYVEGLKSYDVIIQNITADSKTEKDSSELVTGITDSSGEQYTIYINGCIYNKNFPECEGIFAIQIMNDHTLENVKAGIKEPLPK